MMARPKKIIPQKIEKPLSVETAFSRSSECVPSTVDKEVLPDTADRVGNQLQKEIAAHKQGLTRAKYISAINDLLNAVVVTTVYDEMGRASSIETPDKMMRAKGAELAGKFFGDYKEHQSAVTVQHNKILVQWRDTPVEDFRRG